MSTVENNLGLNESNEKLDNIIYTFRTLTLQI